MPLLGKPVSIEIGPESVRVAQVGGRRGVVRTVRFAEQALASGARWEIGGDRAPVVQAVRQALARASIRARAAIIVLPRGQVTARVSAFPPADRDELRRVVEYDLADHIPFPVDQVVVDFQPIGPSREQPGLTDVLVVAAPRELVREHLRVAADLGLSVAAITVDALALDDLARLAGREPAGLGVALQVGSRTTVINVVLEGAPRLTRSVAAGGNQLARAIQDDFGVDADQAKALRESDGLRLLERAPRPGALRAWADGLLGEIRRSALSFGPGRVSRLLLAGEEASMPGLKELLAAEFGIEPIVMTATSAFPRAEFWGTDAGTADRCLMAMAAGLRAVGASAWGLSLVPPELALARRAVRLRMAAAAGALAAVVVLVALYLVTIRHLGAERAGVARLRSELKSTEKQQTRAEAMLTERDRLREQMASLDIVGVRRYAALELLRTIAFYAPKEISLTNFTLRPEQPLELRGSAKDPAAVPQFQRALGASPLVKRINLTGIDLVSSRTKVAEQLTFSMQLHLWTEKEAEPSAVSLRRPEVGT